MIRCYIAAMSKLNSATGKIQVKNNKFIYQDVNGEKTYKGFQTNEVPSFFFLDRAMQDGFVFDKIIFFTTKECTDDQYLIEEEGEESKEMNSKQYVESRIVCYLEREANEEYKNLICDYLGLCHGDRDAVRKYVEKNVAEKYIEIAADMDNNSLYTRIMGIRSEGEAYSDMEIYFDITGGLRLPQFVSMMFIRAIERLGASVKSVVYADFTARPKRIMDCTNQYSILALTKDYKDPQEMLEDLKKHGIKEDISESFVKYFMHVYEEVSDPDLISSDSARERQKEAKQEVDALSKKGSGMVLGQMAKMSKQMEKRVNEKNPFAGLLRRYQDDNLKTNQDLILKYHEELLKAFYCICLIDLAKDNSMGLNKLLASVKYSLEYYMLGRSDKKGKSYHNSVIDEVDDMLNELKKDIKMDAITLFEKRQKVLDTRYGQYFNNYPIGINKKMYNIFKTYLDNLKMKDSYLWDLQGGNRMNLDCIFKMEMIYFNYGFPFYYNEPYSSKLTTYLVEKNPYFIDDKPQMPRNNYIKDWYNLVIRIDKEWGEKKEEDARGYQSYLDALRNDLIRYIPFQYKNLYWEFDQEYFKETDRYENIEEFLIEMMMRLEEVRPIRNAVAHQDDRISVEDRSKLANKIRGWLEEYRMFADEYMGLRKVKVRSVPNIFK